MSDAPRNQEGPDHPALDRGGGPADEELLRRLGAALDAADPIPPAAASTARGLLRWRSDDADLALLGLADLAPVRSGSTLQVHRFTLDDIDIELTVDGTTLAGLIEPWPLGRASDPRSGDAAEGDRVIVEHVGSTERPVEVDDEGEFEVEVEGGGPIRLALSSGGRRIRTEWVLVG